MKLIRCRFADILPPNPPAKDFWAVTIYDTQTRSQLQTDQQFPTLGSQTKGIKTNADGSYDIYFVAPGDDLSDVAERFGTTAEAIEAVNGLTSDMIAAGATLKILG